MGSKEALISEFGYRKIKSNQIEVQQKSLKKWTELQQADKIKESKIYVIIVSGREGEAEIKEKKYNLEVESYGLLGDFTEVYRLWGSFSDSSVELLQRGRGGARIYRRFCLKKKK